MAVARTDAPGGRGPNCRTSSVGVRPRCMPFTGPGGERPEEPAAGVARNPAWRQPLPVPAYESSRSLRAASLNTSAAASLSRRRTQSENGRPAISAARRSSFCSCSVRRITICFDRIMILIYPKCIAYGIYMGYIGCRNRTLTPTHGEWIVFQLPTSSLQGSSQAGILTLQRHLPVLRTISSQTQPPLGHALPRTGRHHRG